MPFSSKNRKLFYVFWPFIYTKMAFWGPENASFWKLVSKAKFTQQQNKVVSPVFESLIQLRLHTARLFTGVTTAFTVCNRIHTCLFSGLTTAFMENPCCVNRTGLDDKFSVMSYSAREPLFSTNARVQCVFMCGFSNLQWRWNELCIIWKFFSSWSCFCPFCVLCVTYALSNQI